MSKIVTYGHRLLSVAAGVLTYFFGEWGPVMTVLLCVVVIDYITGIISAAVKGELCSKKGVTGILKKLFIFLIVALASLVDRLFPVNGAIKTTVCVFYIANEALSILENAGQINLPLPGALKSAIQKLKEKDS